MTDTENKPRRLIIEARVIVFLFCISLILLLAKVTGSWPYLDLGTEVVPVPTEHVRSAPRVRRSRPVDEALRKREQSFLAMRDRTWEGARARWQQSRTTGVSTKEACPIQIVPGPTASMTTLRGPTHESSSSPTTPDVEEKMQWHLESTITTDRRETLGIAIRIQRKPRPLMLERVDCRLGHLPLNATKSPHSIRKGGSMLSIETYDISLTRDDLEMLSHRDTALTLHGPNRIRRKLLLPATDCRWMLEFTNYH